MIVVDTTVSTVQEVFNNTPLATPILDVLNCLLLMKIQGIQDGLTFINENAQVSLPRVDNSTLNAVVNTSDLTLGASSPLADLLDDIVTKWEGIIHQELIVASLILLAYMIVVMMGLARVFYELRKDGKNRGEGTGFKGLPVGQITWRRPQPQIIAYPIPVGPINPFEDNVFELEGPGPTPSMKRKG
jgi:hypothetical protein